MDIYFLNFPHNTFETTEFWCIVGLRAILRLFQMKNSIFL